MLTPVSQHRVAYRSLCFSLVWVVSLMIFLPWAQAQSAKGPVELSTAIMQVAKQTIPAVVHIEVMERQEVANPLLPFEKDPFVQRFSGGRPLPKKFKRDVMGLGSAPGWLKFGCLLIGAIIMIGGVVTLIALD